jgi:pyridoxine 4-dehydrogenase
MSGLQNVNRTKAVCVYGVSAAVLATPRAQGLAYVPFFPPGSFTPLQSSALDAAAALLQATPMQGAPAWLLQRSPNILLIPGTSSLAHLRENLKAATLQIQAGVLAVLDAIGRGQRGQ